MLTEHVENANLNLKFPANPKCGALVRERIGAFAAQHNLDRQDAREFVSAIGEALANAIEHSRSNVIELHCWLDGDDELVATVADSGCGFSGVSEAAALPPPHAERGRGLPLMRRYSDFFRISSEPGKGTTVLLQRKLRRTEN